MPVSKTIYNNFLEEGSLLGNYRILGLLGVGGFGITYKAEHIELGTVVAIKEYMPSSIAVRDRDDINITITNHENSEDYQFGLAKFLSEAKVLASFKHPNIVGINDFFRKNNTAYFVMPFVEGETLGKFASEIDYSFDEDKIINIVIPILEGLRETHSKQILHRDIKLENIFLSKTGMPILIDFGAAKIDFFKKSLNINSILTPPYAPPEQYGNQKQGPWTDIYALGMVMYKLATGLPSSEVPASIDRLQKDSDPLLPIKNSSITPNLKKVILKALSIRVEDRFQQAEEMIDAIMIDADQPMEDERTIEKTIPYVIPPKRSKRNLMTISIITAIAIGAIGSFFLLNDKQINIENNMTISSNVDSSTESNITATAMTKEKAFEEALTLLQEEARDEAKEYFKIASDQGHTKAKVYLGEIYYQEKNYHKAKKYYYEAAKEGDIDGQFWFAEIIRFEGKESQAKVWYRKASEQGHIKAKFMLGEIYYTNDEYGDAQKMYEYSLENHTIDNDVIKKDTLTDEDIETAKLNLTYIYFAIDKDTTKAEDIVPRDIPQGQLYLAQILYSKGDLKESKKWAKKAKKGGYMEASNFIKNNF